MAWTNLLTEKAHAFLRNHAEGVELFSYVSDATLCVLALPQTSRSHPISSDTATRYSQRVKTLPKDVLFLLWLVLGLPCLAWQDSLALVGVLRKMLLFSFEPLIFITFLCFDRVVLTSVAAKIHQTHYARSQSAVSGAVMGDARDLVVCGGCCLCDIRNGPKWALRSYFQQSALSYNLQSNH